MGVTAGAAADDCVEAAPWGAWQPFQVDSDRCLRVREVGQQGGRQAILDESEVEGEVGGLELHPWFEARGAADRLGPGAGGGAGWFEDPRRVGISGQVLTVLLTGGGWSGETDRIVGEVAAVQVSVSVEGVAGVFLGEDKVEVVRQEAGQCGLGFEDVDGEFQGRCGFGEPGHGRGEEGVGGALEHRDSEPTGPATGEIGQVGLRLLELGEDSFGVTDEYLGGGGQPDSTAHSFEQPGPGFPF
jgi:hypothetical protein